MKLTDNWCIQGGEELKQWIRKYDQSNPKKINVIGDNYNMFYWIINPSTFTVWTYEDSPQGRTVITVKQLEEMVAEKDLPQRWAVKRTPENAKVINDWFNDRQSYHYCEIYHFMHWPAFTKECYCSNDLADGYTEISFEQFLKITNQEKTMEKKIIGWRLKKDCEQYREAANKLIDNTLGYKVTGCDFVDHSPSYYILQKAGVLDLWFEKCFEEEKITICGKEVEIGRFGMKSVVINGIGYSKDELAILYTLMNRGQIKSLNVGCNGQEQVDLKLIEKILAKL